MRPRLVFQTQITGLAVALQERIERQPPSLRIKPQEIEALFAAKFGAEHESIRQRIAGEPVGIKRLRGTKTEYFARGLGVGDFEHDDGVQLTDWHEPVVFENDRDAAGAADLTRPRRRVWRLQRQDGVESRVVAANVAQSIKGAAVIQTVARAAW